MLNINDVLKQLDDVGYKVTAWQRPEIKELCRALAADEVIIQTINGHYEGGFGILVATNHRLLLVDRKIMFLTLDSISYSMIQEISLTYRLLNSTLHIFTSNKSLDFSSWNHDGIRKILDYAQKSLVSIRRNQFYVTQGANPSNTFISNLPPTPDDTDLGMPEINHKGQIKEVSQKSINYEPVKSVQSSDSPPLPASAMMFGKTTYTIPPIGGRRVYSRRYF